MGVMKKVLWAKKKGESKDDAPSRWPRRLRLSWKRLDIQKGIMDNLVFRVAYIVEAVVLVSTLCFFFLCCGCHF